jgi:RNA polymerase sigma-70 factor (ECF subfamily)
LVRTEPSCDAQREFNLLEGRDGMSDGDRDFGQLYAEYQPRIRRYMARLVGEPDAEDLTQMAFLKVSQALEDFRGDSAISTWIYRIATNVAIDWTRGAAFKQELQQVPVDVLSGAEPGDHAAWKQEALPLADHMLIRQEMTHCIRQVVEGLPEHDREVIALSEFEGLTNVEIADILGVSLGTVKIRLHRARRRLRKALDDGCTLYQDDRQGLACDRKVGA